MDTSKALSIFNFASTKEVSLDELKSKYKKLAKDRHPDKAGGSSADFIELREAYVVLLEFADKNQTKSSVSLTSLSKEEILKKYQKDTEALQTQLTQFQENFLVQVHALSEVKSKAEQTIGKFERKKAKLKKELEEQIASLEQNISPSIWRRFFLFFLPPISEDRFWSEYHEQVRYFTRKDLEIDVQFYQEMLGIYGETLNELSTQISKVDV
jgi:curved DNA-binding protein CbpA